MIQKDNEFSNGSYAIIENTTDASMDGTEVRVVGIFVDFSPLYRIYAIERKDGQMWSNGYKVFGLTSRCLKPC